MPFCVSLIQTELEKDSYGPAVFVAISAKASLVGRARALLKRSMLAAKRMVLLGAIVEVAANVVVSSERKEYLVNDLEAERCNRQTNK